MGKLFGGGSSAAIAQANAAAKAAQNEAQAAKQALEKQVQLQEKKAEEAKKNPIVIPTINDELSNKAAEEKKKQLAKMSGFMSTLLTGLSGTGDDSRAPTRSTLG